MKIQLNQYPSEINSSSFQINFKHNQYSPSGSAEYTPGFPSPRGPDYRAKTDYTPSNTRNNSSTVHKASMNHHLATCNYGT